MSKDKPVLSLEEAVNKCNDEYILPCFQRDYVWDKKNVKGFLDSLHRKWPTGSIIVWKKSNIRGREFGHMWAKPKDTTANSAVIDGQQRLTTIKLLKDKGFLELDDNSGHKEYFYIFFDLENKEFVAVKDQSEYENDENFIDIQNVLKNKIRMHKYRKKYRDDIKDLKEILNYRIPVIYTRVRKDEDAIEIFNRVNTAGKRIDKGELAYSILKSREHTIAKRIIEFQKNWINQGFDLSNRIIINSFLIVNNIENKDYRLTARQPDKQTRDYLEGNHGIIKDWSQTKELIEDSLKFLGNSGFDSFQFLPTENVIVTLCGYFRMNDNLDNLRDSKINHLKKWLYQTVALGYYKITENFEKDLKDIQRGKKLYLEKRVPVKIDQFSNDGLIGMMYAIGINNGMKEYSGNKLNWAETNQSGMQIQVDHIYPASKLRKEPINYWINEKTVDSVGNKAFIQAKTNKKKLSAFPGEKIKSKNIHQWIEGQRFLKNEDYKKMQKSDSVCRERCSDIEDFIECRKQKIMKSIKREIRP
jgi:hypothetical protein